MIQPPQQPSYQDYINQTFKSPAYTQATKDYNTQVNNLNTLQQQEPGFLQSETSRLQQNDPQYQQLLKGNQAAVSNLYSAPQTAMDQFKDIFNPQTRNALVARAIGNALGQLSGSNALIKQEGGYQSQKAQTALDLLKQKITSAQSGVTASEKNRSNLLTQLDKGFTLQHQGAQQDFTNRIALARLADSRAAKAPKYTVDYTKPTIKGTSYTDPNTGLQVAVPPGEGGAQFKKDGVAVSPIEYATGVGKSLGSVLAASPNKHDQQLGQQYSQLLADAANGKNITNDYRLFITQNPSLFGLNNDTDVTSYLKSLGY